MNEINEFTAALHLAAKALQFYTAEHPRGVEALTTLDKSINAVLEKRPRFAISVSKGMLLLDGQPLEADQSHVKAPVKALAKELDARQLGGFIITKGVNYRELTELVRLFVMKPQQIKDAGGPDEIFRRADVIHIRISHVRYEAVTDGEEVVRAGMIRRPEDADSDSLGVLLRRYLLREGAVGGETSEEDIKKINEAVATPENTRALLKESMTGAAPEVQLAMILSIRNLSAGSLRDALLPALEEMVGKAEGDILSQLVAVSASSDPQVELLRARVAELGISREQLDEVLSVVGWEKLSWSEKIEKLLTGNRIFDFPPEKLIVFVRELLEAGKREEVFYLLERYTRGIEHDSYSVRQNIADTLGQIATFIASPGVGPQVEQLLARATLNHFVKESDARMHATLGEAAASLITAFAASGRSDVALQTLTRLEAAVGVAAPNAPVRQAHESMGRAFAEPRRAAQMIGQIMTADAEALNKSVIPLVVHVGTALAPFLIDALANEEDRNRRGRLIRVLKAVGKPAHPFLLEALQSQTWYVVRNTLNVLGDIGEREHVTAIGKKLTHGDARVRRAAARTLGKIGGPESEALLATAVRDKDPETQNEVLLCLGSMKAQSAVPAVCDLAKSRGDEKVRETAMATLGQIGSDAALPALGDILRPKGIFSRESLAIRAAAAKALAAIGTPEARQLLRNAVSTESDRAAKEAFAKYVT